MTNPIKLTDEIYVCLHEAGHAWVTYLEKGYVEFVELSVESDGKCKGRTRANRPPASKQAIACGGFAVEYLLFMRDRIVDEDGVPITESAFINAAMNNAREDKISYFGVDLNDATGRWPAEKDDAFMTAGIRLSGKLQPSFANIEALARALQSSKKVERTEIGRILGF